MLSRKTRKMTADRVRSLADSHVHSEWSWDAPHGSMERSCQAAVELGLPSVVFTEHADFTSRRVADGGVPDWQAGIVDRGILTPPAFDVAGYSRCLEVCRDKFPGLSISSGVELGEPHWHTSRAAATLSGMRFDRVLASVHLLRDSAGTRVPVGDAYRGEPAAHVVRAYLAEVEKLVTEFGDFDVLAHIDYAARYWPQSAGPYCADEFKEDYQRILAILAARGKTLEINTRVPLHAAVVRWWHDLKGPAVTFASDAHRPEHVARGFEDAAAMAEAAGFAPGPDPLGLWARR